jgi:Protein of unknown function (DUF2442)
MSRRSAKPGKRALDAEVINVSARDFSLLVDGRERFVDFELFPWFREATIGALVNVRRPSPEHLRWPDLDVDLELDSIEHPERYPLVDRALRSMVSEANLRRREARLAASRAEPTQRPERRASH